MVQELVSVIIPTYNRGYIIGAALESLRKQTFRNFEVIVVDDGSEDETADVVGSFSDLDIIYIKLEKNQGVGHARNVGIEHAKGSYIAFLDSDNEYLPRNLAIKMNMITDAPDKIGLVFGSMRRIWNGVEDVYPYAEMHNSINDDIKRVMMRTNVIDTNTVVIKRQCLQNVGLFDESLPSLEDWDMFRRVLFDGRYEALFCEEPLGIYKLQKNSLSVDKDKFFESRTIIYRKSLNDYRKYYDIADIFNAYIFTGGQFEGISLSRRLQGLSTLEFTEDEWNSWSEMRNRKTEIYRRNNKNLATYNKWVEIEEKGHRIVDWLRKNNCNKVAIYGYGYLGKHLVHELEADGISIEFIFDKNPDAEHSTLKICHEPDEISNVDVIIVTAVYYYEDIREELEKVTSSAIVSLWDILSEIVK